MTLRLTRALNGIHGRRGVPTDVPVATSSRGEGSPARRRMGAMALRPVLLEERTSHDVLNDVLDAVEHATVAIDVLAVVIIVIAITYATIQYVLRRLHHDDPTINFRLYRSQIGAGLLLGIEVLVAADVIRTVVLEPTFESVLVLGLLVLIRILLGWSIIVEIEHRWPWQRAVDGSE
jgi:uncharacterized membrane protein